jgi:hypothetical protein
VNGATAGGLAVALVSAVVSGWQQVLAGAQQKQQQVSGVQLLQQVTPTAAALMALMVPLTDNVGLLVGWEYSIPALVVIMGSGVLGLVVMVSAFQMIGATSALTYNILGG